MDPGDQPPTLDTFKTWKLENLRAFLTRRGLSKEGTKDELVALCFSAQTLNLPVIPSKSEVIEENKVCYQNIIDSIGISDPFKMFDCWLDEKEGISQWPPIFLTDITSFFLDKGDKATVSSRLRL